MSENLTLDIGLNSPLHAKLRENLNARFRFSATRMQQLHSKWQKNENQHVAFLPERDVDAKRRQLREQGGKPQYTTIVLPYTYAMELSAWSYWTTVFLGRDPIFQFSGRHGESEQQVQAMEALIGYQVQVGEMLVPLYFWLFDTVRYGLGIIGNYWMEETTSVSKYVEVPQTLYGLPLGGPAQRTLQTEQVRGYYGNKLFNVRPLDYYPDTRVPLHAVQRGEFVGYHTEVGWHELVKRAQAGELVNIDVLQEEGGNLYTGREPGSPQLVLPNDYTSGNPEAYDIARTGPYGIVTFYVDLVPQQWGLSKVGQQEKWVFECSVQGTNAQGGNKSTIRYIHSARPLGNYHNKFPLSVLEMEPEPYTLAARGMPEIIEPMQRTLDWLINSHMYNVRKTMNNQYLVDPSRIVMNDFEEPQPGGAIKASPAAYGTDLRQAISQLPIADVTRGHISDLSIFDLFGQKAMGMNDAVQGQADVKSHTTAGANRIANAFGVGRQKTTTEFMSAMGFAPLGQLLVQTSQQYFDQGTKLRVVGDLIEDAGPQFLQVSPQDIQGFYDFVPVDGTLPIDRFAQGALWQQLFANIAKIPQVSMQYDLGKIFAWVAQLMGLKNVRRFKVQVAPPGIQPQVAAGGNVIPLPMSTAPNLPSGPLAQQIPGMGQTA